VEEVWGLLLLVVRGLMLLKVWLVLVLILLLVLQLLVLLLKLLLLRGSWVVENLLSSLLNMLNGLGRRLRRREKAAGLRKMMRGRRVKLGY
jgi:hypothetical protein